MRPVDVTRDVVEDAGLEHEETAVDPALRHLGLLLELGDHRPLDVQLAEAGRRVDGRDRGQLPVAPVELDEVVEVDVGHPVAVGHEERVVTDVLANPVEPTGRLRRLPGVDQRDSPVVACGLQHLHAVRGEVDGQVRRHGQRVGEVLLDVLALVAEADDEVAEPVVRVVLHDVPEDRSVADLDHRLGPDLGLLREPAADAAGEYHDLHGAPSVDRAETVVTPLRPRCRRPADRRLERPAPSPSGSGSSPVRS